MAVTTEHFYSGNTSTDTFAYTFPYYQTSDIKVKVGGTLKTESTHYNVTGTNIVFTGGNVPPDGTNNIHIYRDTDVDTSKATFAAGSSIRSTDLNNNFTQLLYHEQERTFNTIQTGDIATAEGKGQLVNTNISDTAAIAGTKISPNFGAQNIVTSGTVDGRDVSTDGTKLDGIEAGATGDQTNAEIRAAVEAATDSNVFTDADHSKLNAIEASATADQTGAQIKSAYEAESDTNAYTDAEKTKLAAIEASATADQTNAEIRTAVEAASDSNVFTDADHTKLNAIEASADVTDATNVDAAGAIMNSDLDGKGELLVGDGSGDPTALAVGTNNYVLTADSSEATGVKWAAAGAGGDANQNAFSNVAVSGQTTVAADSTTDTLTLAGGSNVTITTNDSTDTVTIAASGGEVTVQDEGSSLSTAATTLNFVGSGVTASGTGATKTITISGGGGAVTTDYQYLELKAHNNASGAFSAGSADYELVTKGTTTAVSPNQAAALLISIAGVLQEPNTGTSIGSNDGFCIDGSSIHFGANLTAHPDYIVWMKGSGTVVVGDTSITNAKIADDTIAEAKLDIHNAPSGTDKYLKYTSNGMEWATAGSGTPEGTVILSTGESGGTKFLREDGDGSCSWQSVPAGVTQENVEDWVGGMVTGNTETGIAVTYDDSDGTLDFVVANQTPEGTAILSTGESGTTKFLRVDGDGSCSWQVPPDTDTNTQLTTEQVEDIVGGMLDGTETGISVTYDDTDGNIDFVVGTLNQDTTGTADHVTITDNENTDENNLIAFVEDAGGAGSRGLETDGDFHYNPSTGTVTATVFAGSGASLTNLPASISDIVEHKATMTGNHTIGTGNNGLVAGPFSTGSYTLTIPSGSVFTVV